jgi:hypothetical protein
MAPIVHLGCFGILNLPSVGPPFALDLQLDQCTTFLTIIERFNPVHTPLPLRPQPWVHLAPQAAFHSK